MARSLNTVAVKLTRNRAPARWPNSPRNMGVETPAARRQDHRPGTNEVTILDQTTGYSVFPAGGLTSNRHAIQQITDAEGHVLWDAELDLPPRRRVLSEQATKSMNEMFVRNPEFGTARRARLSMTPRRRQDRHHPELSRRLVRRLHRQFYGRRLYGNDSFKPTNKLDRRRPASP